MTIINQTRKKTLARKSRVCYSWLLKARGLMFSWPKKDFGMVFSFKNDSRRPLHMLFVFYPIDVLFLDRNKRVVEVKPGLRPFSAYFPEKKSRHIIELPKGRVSCCRLGDLIDFR